MERVPSLREVFAGLAGGSDDPHADLEAAGYGDLEPHLVDEAIVSYAHGAPVEVAEHLSPFVVAHSGVPQGDEEHQGVPDTGDGLSMLSSAPAPSDDADHQGTDQDVHHDDFGFDELDARHPSSISDHAQDTPDHPGETPHDAGADHGDHADLFFGAGQPAADQPHILAADVGHVTPRPDVDGTGLHDVGADDGGWLDVTEPGSGTAFDVPDTHDDDWSQAHHGHGVDPDPGHDALAAGLDDTHDPDGGLDGGTGV